MDRKKRKVAWFVLACAVALSAFSACKLIGIHGAYLQGDESYRELASSAHPDKEGGAGFGSASVAEIPGQHIDFDALRQVSEDVAAWLYCPNTPIDYPVMASDDYTWYLNHLPDGTYNVNGALFFDYNSPPDLSGRLSIIYGHNMLSGSMFGSLPRYKSQAYFEEHPSINLHTQGANYRIDLIYGCVIGAGEWRDRAFMYEANLPSLLSYAQHSSTFESGVAYTESDRFVVLSTCSYEFDDARYVVVGVLVPEYGGKAANGPRKPLLERGMP